MSDIEVASAVLNTYRPDLSVLHVGPGFGQRGGVASVLRELTLNEVAFKKAGISLLFFETRGFKRAKDVLLFGFFDIPKFVFALSTEVEIVHFHVSAKGSFYRKFIFYLLASAMRKRTLFHWHSNNLEGFHANSGPAVAWAVTRFIKGADAVIGVSTEMSRDLMKVKGKSDGIYTVGNSAYEAEIAADRVSNLALTVQCSRPYLAFAGRFVPEKGLADLFAAVALLKGEGRYIEVKLAGTGDNAVWKKMIADMKIEDRVAFVGWLSGEEKLQFYRNALAFCLPSHREPFGIVTLEAMYCSSPIIGTEAGGFLDLVEDGVTGFLVAPHDPKALANRISVLLDNPERARRMGVAGLERAHRLYSTKAVVSQYVQIYRDVGIGMTKQAPTLS